MTDSPVHERPADPHADLRPVDLRQEKARLRAEALERRAAMGAQARHAASVQAAAIAWQQVSTGPASCVALFCAIHDEIDPRPLAGLLREQGLELALPEVVRRGEPLVFRLWRADDPLTPKGRYAIPTPAADSPVVTPDVVMVPLAAYDLEGYRIGYGAGFYDRTLALLRARQPVRTFGYAFACQRVAHVPREAHDEPVDCMVTQNGAVPCARSGVI